MSRLRLKKRTGLLLVSLTCCVLFYLLLKSRPSVLTVIGKDEQLVVSNVRPPVPGEFLKRVAPSNTSHCRFRFNLPHEFGDAELRHTPQLGAKSPYRVVYDVIKATSNGSRPVLTYCTHLTPHFLYHVAELIRYWDAAISVAVFVPDVDAYVTVQLLERLCRCLPGMERVSVHFVFPENRPPYFAENPLASSIAQGCFIDVSDLETYRNRENLPYPVNVCRNVARSAAATPYVLVSDVELIPSENVPHKFSKLLKHFRVVPPNHVFVLPVFEITSDARIPRTKRDLKRLYDEEKAVYFHRWICVHCQKFPFLVKWLNMPSGNLIKPFVVARREYPFHRWEPIYIGTKNDPFYSETLSWEGQQDKMTQMVEMCLIGYRFVILDGAFLVHWPGMKKRSSESKLRNDWRKPHEKQNTKQYEVIIEDLASKYTENERCKLQ